MEERHANSSSIAGLHVKLISRSGPPRQIEKYGGTPRKNTNGVA